MLSYDFCEALALGTLHTHRALGTYLGIALVFLIAFSILIGFSITIKEVVVCDFNYRDGIELRYYDNPYTV